MELLSQFSLSPYRMYIASRKAHKKIATFCPKYVSDYVDYTVDFSRYLQQDERVLSGGVCMHANGLIIEAVVPNDQYLTAFISGGMDQTSYYLTFTAQTNLGNVLIQEMILPTKGKLLTNHPEHAQQYDHYWALNPKKKPPKKMPPLNAIKIDDRYLLNDSGFFMVI